LKSNHRLFDNRFFWRFGRNNGGWRCFQAFHFDGSAAKLFCKFHEFGAGFVEPPRIDIFIASLNSQQILIKKTRTKVVHKNVAGEVVIMSEGLKVKNLSIK
jgi:hypothetical protein